MTLQIFNINLNLSGLIIGAVVFAVIIFARRLCIWGEYHFTKKFWIFFFVTGLAATIASLFFKNILLSAGMSAFGFIFLWGIHETIEQEERVKKGWFKKKQNKK
ncbi:MAG: DUF4491 family protein [Chlorobi bacterium]|nr:DUF4491 family protein [Chlorobiota bacterium]